MREKGRLIINGKITSDIIKSGGNKLCCNEAILNLMIHRLICTLVKGGNFTVNLQLLTPLPPIF
jgi:hypothetical protein